MLNCMISGELHALMSIDAGDAQELCAFHAETASLCVIVTTHAELRAKDTKMHFIRDIISFLYLLVWYIQFL